jgi:uncharacterized membrane-anchored protein
MNGRKILTLIGAIVVAIIVVKILFAVLGFVFAMIGSLIFIAIAGVVVYMLYRGASNMLSSGKRLT